MTRSDGGLTTIACPDSDPVTISGGGGGACSIRNTDGGPRMIVCTDGTSATIQDGMPCTIDSPDGGPRTITCPGAPPVVIADGTPCVITPGDGGTRTLTCPGSPPVTIRDGTPCTVSDDDAGTKTITCPGSPPVTISDGTPGSSCSVVDNSDGSRTVTCSDGTSATIEPPGATRLTRFEDMPGLVLTITDVTGGSNTDSTFAAGDRISVTFTLENDAGRRVPLADVDTATIWLAGPNTNYQHVIPSTADAIALDDVKTVATLNDDGSYTYVFTTAIPTNFGVPIHDSTEYTAGELTGALTAGTYTVAMNATKQYWIDGRPHLDAGSDTHDILYDHATAGAAREVVADQNCNHCHANIEGHGGRYDGTAICVTCHTSGAEDTTGTGSQTIDFRVMIHKIHNGARLPSVLGIGTATDGTRDYTVAPRPYVVAGEDFSNVIFPMMPSFQIAMPKNAGYSALSTTTPDGGVRSPQQADALVRRGIVNCTVCHGDSDGSGPLAAPAQGDSAYTNPTRRACGSCHDDVDWTRPYTQNGATMAANRTDATCGAGTACHGETGSPTTVRDAHTHPHDTTAVDPDIAATITGVTGAAATSGNFAAGDVPSVSFTLRLGTTDVPLHTFDSFSLGITGPTTARQVLWAGSLTSSPFDFTGRLSAPSTSNRGIMSKVIPPTTGTTVSEPITVHFTSGTAFTVTGLTSGALGTGTLAGSTRANRANTSLGGIIVSGTAVAENLTINFTSPTAFTVTGSVSGALGSGTLPNSVSAVTRFTTTGGAVAFNLTVGSTPFVAGDNIYLTIFRGGAANPVAFAIVPGTTAFANNDRFYYDYVAPAATYTTRIPMDLPLELLGVADGTTTAFTAANLPVWYGRQTAYECTALVGAATTLNSANRLLERWIGVAAIDGGLAANDYIVVDRGTPLEEYVQVSTVNSTRRMLTLSRGLRYAHAAGASVQEATCSFRGEGNQYTLNPTTGVLTFGTAPAAGNRIIMTYRTDGRWGWRRGAGDTLQASYYQPIDGLEGTDETWGDWRGKPYVAGTYTVALWGYRASEYTRNGEWQTYRNTTHGAQRDILYGSTVTTVDPYDLISSGRNCAHCHGDLAFHGTGRRDGDTCMLCHATPGAQVHYNTILHEFHFEALPAMPNGSQNCAMCHGTSTVWNAPTNRNHPTAQVAPVRVWTQSCTTGCHATASAQAHANAQTSATGVESCDTCHGADGDFAVEVMHRAR